MAEGPREGPSLGYGTTRTRCSSIELSERKRVSSTIERQRLARDP